MNRLANLPNALMLALLLGTSATLSTALIILLMSSVILTAYSICIGPLRLRLSGNSLLLASLVLAATLTSCANILAQRWALQWQQSLGIYAG
ncbi:NADH:quinone oxidoreductase, partial [Pseudomonas sp. HMWF021]